MPAPTDIPAKVDGVAATPDVHGVVDGNGGAVDKISGAVVGGVGQNDKLEGEAAFNQYYGGAGNDTFIISDKMAIQAGAHNGQSTAFANQFAYISDFQKAGPNGSTGDHDFIAFTGNWIANSLHLTHTGSTSASGATLYYYSVSDTTGHTFNIEINSLDGKALGAGDFKFY